MPFELKNKNDTIENTPINTTTKQTNANEETNLLTSLQRKPEETKEKEGIFGQFMNKLEDIFGQFMNKFSNAIKMKEPGWMSYHLPGEHTEKMLNIGLGTVLFGMGSAAGALLASAAGSPIVAGGLAFTAVFSMCAGVFIAAIATLRD